MVSFIYNGSEISTWIDLNIDLSCKPSLTCGGNVNYYKCIKVKSFVHHPIPTLPVEIGNTQVILSIYLCSLLGQSEREWKALFGGCKKWGHMMRLPPRAFGSHKRWKVTPFVKFEVIFPLLCFLLDPLTISTAGHAVLW